MNGPTMVKGASSVANPIAMSVPLVACVGSKKKAVAMPTWNMPSPACDTSRVYESRRKPFARHKTLTSDASDMRLA